MQAAAKFSRAAWRSDETHIVSNFLPCRAWIAGLYFRHRPWIVYNLLRPTLLRWGSRHDELLDALRAAIVNCEIAPGSRLVQDDLAARFGVSRIPLREALRTLEAEGLVVGGPNPGAGRRPP